LSAQMVERAREKRLRHHPHPHPAPAFIQGCAEKLPFANHTFDAITIAFGVRNFENRQVAFAEAFRVLRPGGCLLILEFATPKNRLWRFIFHLYFFHILPLLGYLMSGNKKAYRYLPSSVSVFPQYEALGSELSESGFTRVCYRAYTGGVAVLYMGLKI